MNPMENPKAFYKNKKIEQFLLILYTSNQCQCLALVQPRYYFSGDGYEMGNTISNRFALWL